MNVDSRFSVGSLVSSLTLIGMIVALGVTYGQVTTRLESVEAATKQSHIDSRTLIEVGKDVAYIKESIQRIERASSMASVPLALCSSEKPILVASHCRSYPLAD